MVFWLALSASLQAQQYVFRAYRQAEGLKNLGVNALATDRKGFLWVATENGVYRFLGSGFQRYGPDQGIDGLDIHALVVDPDDTVWAAANQDLYRWDGQRFVPARSRPIQVAAWNHMAVEDGRHLLIVEKHRLYRLEHDAAGRTLSYFPVFSDRLVASNPDLAQVSAVSVVTEPLNGLQIWIGCGKKLYSWVDGESGIPGDGPPRGSPAPTSSPGWKKGGLVQPRDGNLTEWGRKKGLGEDTWESVLVDRAGTLWAGGRYRVAVLPRGSARFVDRSIPGSTRGNAYAHAPFIEDREGRVLAPCEDGIARWDGNGWRIIGRANGLQLMGHIGGMAFDAAGDLWLATRGDGLSSWVGYEDWEGWNDVQSLPSAVIWTMIPSRDKRIFIGTDKGPAWIDPRSGSSGRLFKMPRWTFGQTDALGINDDGTLWAGTFSAAVLRIDAKTGETTQTAKLPSFITRTLADSSGRVFFTTDEGIFARESGDPKAAPRRIGAADAFLTASAQVDTGCRSPNGALWFLTHNRLLRLQDGQWTEPPIDGMPNKLRGPLLDLSCSPDGALWATGQLTGTWRLTPGGDRMDAWRLELPPEMHTLAPLAILADGRGWVWLGTDLGLAVWNGHSWRHLTQESGLIWNDIDQGAMLAAPDGSVWIGTSGGVAHLLHPEHVFDSAPLTAMVTGIRRGDDLYPAAQGIRLPWSALPLHFQISSPAMRNRSELIFKYRMDGLQPDWIESQDGMAVFSNLPAGAYTFAAMARNPSLSAFSAIVKVKVRILPPWWKTWWFYALCGIGSVLLLLAAVRIFVGHLRRRSRELEKLVRERTHELELSREQLRIQATHDGLTGMLNRMGVLRALAAEMDRSRRENRPLVVALVDLDHFKRINDAFGHMAGDEALRRFANAVGSAIRPYDHAGRYGGEEFLLVLTEIPPEAAEQRLASLYASISNLKVRTRVTEFGINCSIGATVFDPSAGPVSEESLLAIADQALYEAKAAGRNRVVFKSVRQAGASDETLLEHSVSTI
ncbi:MAG: diguanylate cyclase [Terracidiphilus sp.]|jgi:diguanylate cyclase (GGDEF)-like protein